MQPYSLYTLSFFFFFFTLNLNFVWFCSSFLAMHPFYRHPRFCFSTHPLRELGYFQIGAIKKKKKICCPYLWTDFCTNVFCHFPKMNVQEYACILIHNPSVSFKTSIDQSIVIFSPRHINMLNILNN